MKRWVPNALTVFNGCAGLLSVLLSLQGYYLSSAGAILAAALFDSFDGRIARRLNITTEFGKELDGLADLISFGVAPATLEFLNTFIVLGWSGYIIAAVFPAIVALRLMRLKTVEGRNCFQGLPISVAGPILAGVALLGKMLPLGLHVAVVLLLSVLIISKIRIPKI